MRGSVQAVIRTLCVALFSLIMMPAAAAATLPDGALGCVSEADLDQFIQSVVRNDKRLSQSMIEAGQCGVISGAEFSVLERGVLTSRVRVYTPSGQHLDVYVPATIVK